jgi:glycerophosphoryl diester phosphodiesterase
LAAFRRAVEIGVDYIELDLHLTKDGEVVVIHDDELERTTNGRGLVHEATLADVRALDAGSWFNRQYPDKAKPEFAGEKIPTLQEALDLVRGTNTKLYLETKNGPFYLPDLEERIVELIQRSRMQAQVVVESFDHASVKKIKRLDPSLRTAILVGCKPIDPTLNAQAAQANELAPAWVFATPDFVEAAHRHGYRVMVWTVDDASVMRQMIANGVDGIMTNDPALLKQILHGTADKRG